MGFCDILEVLHVECTPCIENKEAVCDIKGRVQPTWGGQIHDTISILRGKSGRMFVRTDIEIPWKVRGDPSEQAMNVEDKLSQAVKPELPEGANVGTWHFHYSPNINPDMAASHLHVNYPAKSIEDASEVARKLQKLDVQKLIDIANKGR